MDPNRKTAYNALLAIETKNAYSNIAINHHIICGRPTSPAFVRELVYGVLENKLLLDYIIGKFVKSGVDKIKKSDLIILRMGIYQLRFMDNVPEYAAVNESVVLARQFSRGREPFINGVLRSYLRTAGDIDLPKKEQGLVEYLSVNYSYAPWIVELWLEEYSEEFVEELLNAGNETPELAVRVNTTKTTATKLKQKFEEQGFVAAHGRICDNSLYVKGTGLLDTDMYKQGLFSVQDEASILAIKVLDPQKGEFVMDLCAAPGGKTLAMAEKMEGTGKIIASDIYKRKLAIIESEAERLGLKNIKTAVRDAAVLDEVMVGKADRVLIDAPCSGLGVIRKKPEIKYKKRSTEMDSLPRKQYEILCTGAKYVKVGGTLVYSTCTVNPQENRMVIERFLKKNPNFKKEDSIQLLPNINKTDGFFICKLERTK